MKRFGIAFGITGLAVLAGLYTARSAGPRAEVPAAASQPEPEPGRHRSSRQLSPPSPTAVGGSESPISIQVRSTRERLIAARPVVYENLEQVGARMHLTPDQLARLRQITDISYEAKLKMLASVVTEADWNRFQAESTTLMYARLFAEGKVFPSSDDFGRYQQLISAAARGLLNDVDDDGFPGKPGNRRSMEGAIVGSGHDSGLRPVNQFDSLFASAQ